MTACGAPRSASPWPPAPSPPAPPPTLAQAIQRSADLGPARSDTTVYLSFGLRTRQPARLAALIASGRTVSPAAYTAEFGPDPTAVAPAVAALQAAGFRASWQPGSGVIGADG